MTRSGERFDEGIGGCGGGSQSASAEVCKSCGQADSGRVQCGECNAEIHPRDAAVISSSHRIIDFIEKARKAHTADTDRLIAKLEELLDASVRIPKSRGAQ